MIYLHALMAFFACWRLVEIVQVDSVFGPVRRLFSRWPFMLTFLGCHRCISVWIGGLVTLLVYFGGFYPYINWAFALSFLFIRGQEIYIAAFNRLQGGIYIDPVKGQVNWGGFMPANVVDTLKSVVYDVEQRLEKQKVKQHGV